MGERGGGVRDVLEGCVGRPKCLPQHPDRRRIPSPNDRGSISRHSKITTCTRADMHAHITHTRTHTHTHTHTHAHTYQYNTVGIQWEWCNAPACVDAHLQEVLLLLCHAPCPPLQASHTWGGTVAVVREDQILLHKREDACGQTKPKTKPAQAPERGWAQQRPLSHKIICYHRVLRPSGAPPFLLLLECTLSLS